MPKTKPLTQSEKFKRAARDLECDPSEQSFDRTLKQVAKSGPPKDPKPKPAKRGRD